MASRTVDAQRDVIAEPAGVWSVVADAPRWPKILGHMYATSATAPIDREMSWTETYPFGPLEVMATIVEPERELTMRLAIDTVAYTVTYRLAPSSLGTRLRVEVEGEYTGGGMMRATFGVMGVLHPRFSKETLDRDLALFAKIAEERVRRYY